MMLKRKILSVVSIATILVAISLFVSSIPVVLGKPNCITVTVKSIADHRKSPVVGARVDIYTMMPPPVAQGYTGKNGRISFSNEPWLEPNTMYTAIAFFGDEMSDLTFTTDSKASANVVILLT